MIEVTGVLVEMGTTPTAAFTDTYTALLQLNSVKRLLPDINSQTEVIINQNWFSGAWRNRVFSLWQRHYIGVMTKIETTVKSIECYKHLFLHEHVKIVKVT